MNADKIWSSRVYGGTYLVAAVFSCFPLVLGSCSHERPLPHIEVKANIASFVEVSGCQWKDDSFQVVTCRVTNKGSTKIDKSLMYIPVSNYQGVKLDDAAKDFMEVAPGEVSVLEVEIPRGVVMIKVEPSRKWTAYARQDPHLEKFFEEIAR